MKKTVLLLFVFLPSLLVSQQHPLAVESAALLESGHAQFDFGVSYFRAQPFPLSGLEGNLSKIGNVRFCISLSEYVELQTDGTLLNILDVKQRKPAFNSARIVSSDPTSDIGDFSVWTKFRVLNDYASGFGLSLRFGIQLPNASTESGLGVDEMNFFSSLLMQQYFAGKWTMNVGLGILSNPTTVSQQHDVYNYGIEYSLPAGESTFLLLQTAGRTGHEGTGIRNLASAKMGLEISLGDISLKAFGVSNFSSSDRSKGIELSALYLFHIIDITR